MGKIVGTFCAVSVAIGIFAVLAPQTAFATAGVNQEISFEGKIVTAAGVNIPNGTYNMEFKIYTAAGSCNPANGSGCILGWTEDWLVSASNGVAFTSGTFQVNLDHVAANNFSGIDFNTYPLYLSMQIGGTSSCTPAGNFTANCGGDGEMKPYIKFTSTPYALNTDLLDGLDSTAFGQLAANNTWTGTNLLRSSSATALQVQNGSNNSLLTVDASANQVRLGKPGASGVTGTLVFNNAAGTNTITIAAQPSNPSSSLSIFLPTTGATGTQCLQSTSGSTSTSTTLQFGACGGGGSTLASAYSSGANQSDSTISLDSVRLGVVIKDASSAISGSLLTVQNNAGTTKYLDVTSTTFAIQAGSTVSILSASGSNLTVAAQGAGQSNFGTTGTGASVFGNTTGATTVRGGGIAVTAGAASSFTTSAGALTLTAAASSVWSTSAGTLTIQSASGSAFTASSQGAGQSNFGTAGTGITLLGNSTGSTELIGPAYTTSTKGVLVGDGTVGATPILLQLNNSSLDPASEATANCSTTINAGAIYYSAATATSAGSGGVTTNEVRGCINGNWADIVSGDQLGILLFGVVEDSGPNNPGDINGISGYANAPCKVAWASATSVTVAPCTAYSGGRKVVIGSTATISGLGTAGSIRYQHICLTGTNGAPAATPSNTSETAGVPAFTAAAPVLCLATVKLNTTPAISNIYDTRVFTTSTKEYAGNSVAMAPGWIVIIDSSADNLVTTTTSANTSGVRGVIAAGNPSAMTSTVGVVIVTAGPAYVKFTSSPSVGAVSQTGTTAGYMATTTTTSKYGQYRDLGQVVANGNAVACTGISTCQYSALVDVVLY